MYEIIISRIAEKQLASFPKHVANNITAKIDLLSLTPRPVGSKN
jgi:mRNA-degrading endonuclease RelE of RelBE toxin-antitoxin system